MGKSSKPFNAVGGGIVLMYLLEKNTVFTVNALISGHHRGNDFCPLIGDVRLLERLIFLTYFGRGRCSSKVQSQFLVFKTKIGHQCSCQIHSHKSKGCKITKITCIMKTKHLIITTKKQSCTEIYTYVFFIFNIDRCLK